MNYTGAGRSNYFKVIDLAGLHKALEPFGGWAIKESRERGTFALFCEDGWPGTGYDGDDNEVEFSFEEKVMPFVAEGEVVVAMDSGSEGMRYLAGSAWAYVRAGEKVESCGINLTDIYGLAAKAFKVCQGDINLAEY